ncbi:hypothetical protein BpHYR1_048888 [Brachionus plicatilis]|uniref:Uncharacterized protein n=1 Tax=Brachionus plicatilis TaxID=10195 RepID=A0A3M7SND8_BRAPC|nr:hypothetical protein BpHYR1_048888 [Brachionus plicatilis]
MNYFSSSSSSSSTRLFLINLPDLQLYLKHISLLSKFILKIKKLKNWNKSITFCYDKLFSEIKSIRLN